MEDQRVNKTDNDEEYLMSLIKSRSKELNRVIIPLIDQIALATIKREYCMEPNCIQQCDAVIDYCIEQIGKVLKPVI